MGGWGGGVRYLGGGEDGVGGHDTVWELLSDLVDEEGTHAGASAAAQTGWVGGWVGELCIHLLG